MSPGILTAPMYRLGHRSVQPGMFLDAARDTTPLPS